MRTLRDITVSQIAVNQSCNSFDLNHIRGSSWIVANTRVLFDRNNIRAIIQVYEQSIRLRYFRRLRDIEENGHAYRYISDIY